MGRARRVVLMLTAMAAAVCVTTSSRTALSLCEFPSEVMELELDSVTVDGAPGDRAPYQGRFFAVRSTLTCFGPRDENDQCPRDLIHGVDFVVSDVPEDAYSIFKGAFVESYGVR